VDCPREKYKNFIVGRFVSKTLLRPGQLMVDEGSTTIDATCEIRNGSNTIGNINKPGKGNMDETTTGSNKPDNVTVDSINKNQTSKFYTLSSLIFVLG